MRDILLFFRSWLHKRREVASVIPSSRWLAKAVCKKVRQDTRQVVVEFGPGTGPLTKALLKPGMLTPDSRLIVVESNDELASYVRRHFHDPRITIVHDTAGNVRAILDAAGEKAADTIISGIPYSYFTEEQRDGIVRGAADALGPGGTHIVYQVTRSVLPHLKRWFGNVEESIVLLNVPPLRIFVARKDAD